MTPDIRRLPQRAASHVQEAQSRLHIQNVAPAEWIWEEPHADYGWDFFVTPWKNAVPTGQFFGVQLKSRSRTGKSLTHASVRVSARTLQFWISMSVATIVVVEDAQSGTLHWGLATDLAADLAGRQHSWASRQTVTLRVPRVNELREPEDFDAVLARLPLQTQEPAVASRLRQQHRDVARAIVDCVAHGRPISSSNVKAAMPAGGTWIRNALTDSAPRPGGAVRLAKYSLPALIEAAETGHRHLGKFLQNVAWPPPEGLEAAAMVMATTAHSGLLPVQALDAFAETVPSLYAQTVTALFFLNPTKAQDLAAVDVSSATVRMEGVGPATEWRLKFLPGPAADAARIHAPGLEAMSVELFEGPIPFLAKIEYLDLRGEPPELILYQPRGVPAKLSTGIVSGKAPKRVRVDSVLHRWNGREEAPVHMFLVGTPEASIGVPIDGVAFRAAGGQSGLRQATPETFASQRFEVNGWPIWEIHEVRDKAQIPETMPGRTRSVGRPAGPSAVQHVTVFAPQWLKATPNRDEVAIMLQRYAEVRLPDGRISTK